MTYESHHTKNPPRDVLTVHQEGPTAGHMAKAIGCCAAVPPTVPHPGSPQAEVMGCPIFINLNDAFSSPHRAAFQEPGHFRLWYP